MSLPVGIALAACLSVPRGTGWYAMACVAACQTRTAAHILSRMQAASIIARSYAICIYKIMAFQLPIHISSRKSCTVFEIYRH